MAFRYLTGLAAAASLIASREANAADWVVRPEWVKAHEDFLASPALQGRGSATRDEAIAAAYVASQFEGYGLKPAPGLKGFTQVGRIVRPHLAGTPTLTLAGGAPLKSSQLIMGANDVHGAYAVLDDTDASRMAAAQIVVVTNAKADVRKLLAAANDKQVKLLILPESDATQGLRRAVGGAPALRAYLEGSAQTSKRGTVLATLSNDDIAALAHARGRELVLSAPVTNEIAETTNAIAYLPGTDPAAGVLLVSAHLDHLGLVDGTIMPGANDDASGTTGVLELAHALASGPRTRRGILFVCYGSEELGGFGSRYFGEHPAVPLEDIVANLELEMIGAQDAKLPPGTLMMTGFERSDFGQLLKSKGALVASDPYPEQDFFERSDNYSLALKGIVAHTVSGWPLVTTYHQSTDTVANLDLAYMTRAIQSLIEPLRYVANGTEKPRWRPDGQPQEK